MPTYSSSPTMFGQNWGAPSLPAQDLLNLYQPSADYGQGNGNSSFLSTPYINNDNTSSLFGGSFMNSYGSAPTVAAGGGKSFLDGMLGVDGKAGWGGLALGAAQGIGNLFLGMKQYGLAKDTLAENKRQFALNYGAQQKLTNSQLADRQAARITSAGNGQTQYASVADYMKNYGV